MTDTIQPPNDGSQPIAISYSEHDGVDGIAFWFRTMPGADMRPIFLGSEGALLLNHGLREAIGGETDPRVVNHGEWPLIQVGYDLAQSAVSVDLQLQPDDRWLAVLVDDGAAYALADTVLKIISDRDQLRGQIDEQREADDT